MASPRLEGGSQRRHYLDAIRVSAILLLIPRTSSLGILLTSSFWGGAICAHMMQGDSYAFVAVLLVLRFSGPEVVARFSTVFASSENRDESAESRLTLWSACIDSMTHNPLGVGPSNWGAEVVRYGFKRGKWWPFIPTGEGQSRDNATELELKAKLEPELPIEPDLTRWLGLFDAPI